jgi:hypothetical protein
MTLNDTNAYPCATASTIPHYSTIVNNSAQNGAFQTHLWTVQKKSRSVERLESQQGGVKEAAEGPLQIQMAWINTEVD